MCHFRYKPVCGSDNRSYLNHCFLRRQSCLLQAPISAVHQGRCSKFYHFVGMEDRRSDLATCKYVWDWITLMHSRQSSFEALNRTKIIIWFSHRIFKLCFGFKSRFDHWLDLSCVTVNSKRTVFVNSQLFLTVLFIWIVLVYTRHLSLNVTVLRRIGFLFFTAM